MWRWTLWFLAVVVSFGVLEGAAVVSGSFPTLSASIWAVTAFWPPLPFLFGLVVGFLACHFFWPNQGLKT